MWNAGPSAQLQRVGKRKSSLKTNYRNNYTNEEEINNKKNLQKRGGKKYLSRDDMLHINESESRPLFGGAAGTAVTEEACGIH